MDNCFSRINGHQYGMTYLAPIWKKGVCRYPLLLAPLLVVQVADRKGMLISPISAKQLSMDATGAVI